MKLKILPKLLLYILLPSILGLCSMATMDYINSRNAMTDMLQGEINFIVKGQQGELNNIFSMLDGVMKTLAQQNTITELLGKPETAMDASARSALLDAARFSIKDVSSNFNRIKDVALVDKKGTVLIHSSDQKFVGADVSNRPYIKAALSGKMGVTTLQSQVTKKLTTALGQPVFYNKEIVGAIYLTLNLEELSQATVETIKLANTGMCFVIDSNGQLVLHPNKKLVGMNIGDRQWVKNLKNLKPGRFTYEWEGVNKIGNFQLVPAANWIVVMGVEEADILTPITQMLQYSLMVVSVLVLVLIIIITFVSYNFATILKKLAILVNYIGAGNFLLDERQRRELDKTKQRGDEISTLAEGVDLMTENLKTMFTEAEEKTEEARKATEKAHEATESAEAARAQAEHAKRDGMLAAAAQLEEVVESLTSASAQLSAQIEQSERGASEQADRITHTATAMDEMTATVLEVAQNASKASELSIETRAKASSGADLVDASLTSMRQVQKFSVALKTDMEQLNEKAQSISHIMGVISDIADQTNLLALNAAIEAARAGDAGRGFAVVADEVRKLAEKTMGSTTEVGKAIKDIQNSTSQSMLQVDTTVQHIEQTTEQSQQSGAALKEIVAMIDTTVDQVRSIATASEEQSATSQEINQAITDVNNVSAETARAMQEASRAVEDLARQAQNLNTLITQMKES